MAANRLPASLMKALDPAAGARRSRWTAARAGAPRCPYISRRSRPASGPTVTVPSSLRRGELPRRLRAPCARNVIPGAHAADPALLAAKKVTQTIPVVGVGMGGDPVGIGLVASLARPGGNITGVSGIVDAGFVSKWAELLKEAAPRISRVGYLHDANNPVSRT